MTDPATPTGEAGETSTPFSDLVFRNVENIEKEEGAAPERRTAIHDLLALFRAPLVQAVLDGAETVTQFTTDRRILQGLLNVFPPAKEFLRGFPRFSEHLAGVEEAERALENVVAAVGEDYTTPEQGQTALLSMRAVVRSMDNALAALEAEARAAHARKVRADRRADLAAAPEDEREKIAAAIDRARTIKEQGEQLAYDLVANTTNAPLEILGNSIVRGQTSKPAVVLRHPVDPARNTIGFRGRERLELKAEEEAAAFVVKRKPFSLTGGEVLGAVERAVWRAIMKQAEGGKNPADLVGVSIRAYAAQHGISYKVAKEEIAKAIRNIYLLDMNLEEGYARKHGLPINFRFIESIWGEDKTLAEGFYLVRLSGTMVDHLAAGPAGRGVQLPLLPAVNFIRNPRTDMFVHLFAIQAVNSTGNSNENIVSVAKLAEAANLLDKKHLDRARAIIERDLHAGETCGRGKTPAPFKAHHYRSEGKRISTAKALALPPREWLKLTVEVEWNDGTIDYREKRRAIRERRERAALAEAIVTTRKGTKK